MTTSEMQQQPYYEWIDNVARKPHRTLWNSTLGRPEAIDELADVWDECRQPGWDGYDALPVEQETLREAYSLITTLPLGFPRPSIGAEPDGQITLEWRVSTTRILSVSVDPNGFLHYAGLYGASKRYGTLAFYGEAPKELLQIVREL